MANKKSKKSTPSSQSPGVSSAEPQSVNNNSSIDVLERSDLFAAKSWLMAAIAVAVVWWIGLSLLTLLSANPTTVNRTQVVDSDLVVVAEVQDVQTGIVTVTRQWIDPNPQTSLTVSGLADFDVKNGDTVVLPLTGGPDGTFYLTRVQRTKLNPNGKAYIYPASDVVFEQVDEFAAIQ